MSNCVVVPRSKCSHWRQSLFPLSFQLSHVQPSSRALFRTTHASFFAFAAHTAAIVLPATATIMEAHAQPDAATANADADPKAKAKSKPKAPSRQPRTRAPTIDMQLQLISDIGPELVQRWCESVNCIPESKKLVPLVRTMLANTNHNRFELFPSHPSSSSSSSPSSSIDHVGTIPLHDVKKEHIIPALFRALLSAVLRSASVEEANDFMWSYRALLPYAKQSCEAGAGGTSNGGGIGVGITMLGFTARLDPATRAQVWHDLVHSASRDDDLLPTGPALSLYHTAGAGAGDSGEYRSATVETRVDAYVLTDTDTHATLPAVRSYARALVIRDAFAAAVSTSSLAVQQQPTHQQQQQRPTTTTQRPRQGRKRKDGTPDQNETGTGTDTEPDIETEPGSPATPTTTTATTTVSVGAMLMADSLETFGGRAFTAPFFDHLPHAIDTLPAHTVDALQTFYHAVYTHVLGGPQRKEFSRRATASVMAIAVEKPHNVFPYLNGLGDPALRLAVARTCLSQRFGRNGAGEDGAGGRYGSGSVPLVAHRKAALARMDICGRLSSFVSAVPVPGRPNEALPALLATLVFAWCALTNSADTGDVQPRDSPYEIAIKMRKLGTFQRKDWSRFGAAKTDVDALVMATQQLSHKLILSLAG